VKNKLLMFKNCEGSCGRAFYKNQAVQTVDCSNVKKLIKNPQTPANGIPALPGMK
jgi:hypothetical protein